MRNTLSYLIVTLLFAAPAGAQQVSLEIKDGRVNLETKGATLRTILTEWEKVGGTRIVGVEKVTGAPLTLTLEDVSEREALEVLMRDVAGYMAAPRAASAEAGASVYDRIMVLASSSAPAASAATSQPAPRGPAGVPRFVRPRPDPRVGVPQDDQQPDGQVPMDENGYPVAQDQYGDPDQYGDQDAQYGAQQNDQYMASDQEPDVNAAPQVFTFPKPGQFGQPYGNTVTPPAITLQPDPNGGPPTFIAVDPEQMPQNGFTIIGSPTPGMIQQPPPQPEQPGTPVRRRPPG